jgi:hypothetical protein
MVNLTVPPTTDIYEPVTLSCEYDLQGGNLYSVKWYKDESEFFRYMPDYKQKCQAVPAPGISLDVSNHVTNCIKYV